MNPTPPLPSQRARRVSLSRRAKLVLGVSLLPAFFVGALIVLRILGFVRPFSVPTAGMAPAVSAGDHVMMKGVTYLARQPHRGDVVVFRTDGIAWTDGIASLPQSEIYVKRVAGEPGDHVRISARQLYINDKHVALSNSAGEITYDPPPRMGTYPLKTDVVVPDGCYYVLGDNSTNSLDSRFWGCLPRANILGRMVFCYWPPNRVGGVK
jgi:signal peptidase I